MEKNILLEKSKLDDFLGKLSEGYQVYVPAKKDEQRFFRKYAGPAADIVIGEVRPFEPLKAFFSRAREKVADGFKPDVPHDEDKPFAIVGVKACDLKGFKIQDHVFKEHDFPDAFYIRNREKNLIVSADCTCAIETCFCTALGIQPHPEENFDLNLSEVADGFVLEIGSEKGRAFIQGHPSLFSPAGEKPIREKKDQRAQVTRMVDENIRENDIPRQDLFQGVIERNFNSDIWVDEAKTCVECGACTIICPTCHCFLLYDQQDQDRMARLRVWDSCMLKGYAHVAGGGNPRPKLFMRLRNRFEKKFDFFPKRIDVYACTGCGRCVSACPAKIDIRKMLKRLVNNA
ncbi:MAG: 4Fe-4S dicluster domain-containing protein [Candidatus Omnitrophota bacterium]